MVKGIRTIYLCGLNKGFTSKSCVDSQIRHETPEEGWRMYRPKREYKDKENSSNTLNDKNYYASS